MDSTMESAVMSTAEREKLKRLLEQTPLAEMAKELGDYYKRLRAAGFKKWQAWNMTYELHSMLCAKIFDS